LANAADSRVTSYYYDAFGNIVQTTNPDGTFIRTGYNAKGQKVSETNQLDQTRAFEYDAQGRLTRVVMPKVANETTSPVYEYAYDARGNQTLIRDPLGRETTFDYDSRGNMVKRTLPMNQIETFQYDDFGRQIFHKKLEAEGIPIFVFTKVGR
jgi:YD repeat-containing protein